MSIQKQINKTLLLVDSMPGSATVGEILIREMLSFVDPQQYVIAALLRTDNNETASDTDHYNIKTFLRPQEAVGFTHSKARRLKNAICRVTGYERDISTLANNIGAFAREKRINRVWSIFGMTSVIDVTYRLMPKLNVPLLAHVWDDVDHLTQQRNLDYITRKRTRKRFSKLLHQAEKTAVICEAMQHAYETDHGAKCCVVRHGISDHVEPRTEQTSEHEFRIGFSGGVYAHSAWQTLLEALSLLQWRVKDKQIKFVVMSDTASFKSRTAANVEFLGWQSMEEVATKLSNCDLLYLPQAFEAHQRPLSELSFPTKLSAYANTGRPVLIHTPTYGSLSEFYRRHPIGGLCQELNAEKLAHEIRLLSENRELYANAARAAAHVAETVLSRHQFEQQVRNFLCETPVLLNDHSTQSKVPTAIHQQEQE